MGTQAFCAQSNVSDEAPQLEGSDGGEMVYNSAGRPAELYTISPLADQHKIAGRLAGWLAGWLQDLAGPAAL